MNDKIGFFQDDINSKSHIRLMSFMVFWLLTGIDYAILFHSYYSDKVWDTIFVWVFLGVNFLFLIAIFYPKYLQKILELGQAKFQQVKEKISEKLPSE